MLEEKQYDATMLVIRGIREAFKQEVEVEYLMEVLISLGVDFNKVEYATLSASCKVLD
jgi:hypothetical protein